MIQEEDVLTQALFPGPAQEFFKKREAKASGLDADLINQEFKLYPV